MYFGWINVFGASIVVLMLIPNILYAVKNKGEKNKCNSVCMNTLEQIGRYSCIILMWLPLGVRKFGFGSVAGMLLYLAGNGILLLAYWTVFMRHLKDKTAKRALLLAVLPACIFFWSGVLLRHWLLAGAAVLFATGHIYVTMKNVEYTEIRTSHKTGAGEEGKEP